MKPTTIILVEDNPDYREAVKLALAEEPDLELKQLFGAAELALRSLKNCSAEEAPDIILLDISLPGLSGIDALASLRSCCPDSRILMLTQSGKAADVLRAIREGAAGYLLKSSSLDELVEGIRNTMTGGAALDTNITHHILGALSGRTDGEAAQYDLSEREIEILELLSRGSLKKQIADLLEISENTVADHVKRIYRKLDVKNSPAAVSKAIRAGLLQQGGKK